MVKKTIEVDLKWYTARQNNSGGKWYINDDVDVYVSVEARNTKEAITIFQNIVEDYSNYCSCCGERWYEDWTDEDGFDVPSYYEQPLQELDSFGKEWLGDRQGAVLYYYDGRKEKL